MYPMMKMNSECVPMLSSSASRLSKAYLCGKMSQPLSAPPSTSEGPSFSYSSLYQEDGNLRHALMEFYLKHIASKTLALEGNQMRDMAKGESWRVLNEFLDNKNTNNSLGDISQLHCRKTLKKLRKAINFLSNYFQKYGELVYIDSEVPLEIGTPINVSDSIQIERGEIDAVFVFKNESGDITVVVIDWKRGLSNSDTLIQYECQIQAYVRCIQSEPALVNITQEQIQKAELKAYLVEIGGFEGTRPEIVEVETDSKVIDNFLSTAATKFESSEATPGFHCSSWCRWAFADEHCNSITTESLSINFHSDEFWQELKFHAKWLNALVQFTNETPTILEIGGENIIHFDNNRELHLKDIDFYRNLYPNSVIRVEGSIIRHTPYLAYMNVKHFKIIE